MPSSVLVAVALGGLIAAALLGPAFDHRTLAVVLAAAAVPDLDAVAALVVPGVHNALLHTLLVPLSGAALLYYDTAARERSWVRERFGRAGVRTAWVALAAYAFAIGLDLFNVEGANVLYPLHDQYYSVVGKATLSNEQGLVQTYVTVDPGGFPPVVLGEPRGATGEYVPAPPLADLGDGRFVPFVHSGWQFLLVTSSAAVLAARLWLAAPAGTTAEPTDRALPED